MIREHPAMRLRRATVARVHSLDAYYDARRKMADPDVLSDLAQKCRETDKEFGDAIRACGPFGGV